MTYCTCRKQKEKIIEVHNKQQREKKQQSRMNNPVTEQIMQHNTEN